MSSEPETRHLDTHALVRFLDELVRELPEGVSSARAVPPRDVKPNPVTPRVDVDTQLPTRVYVRSPRRAGEQASRSPSRDGAAARVVLGRLIAVGAPPIGAPFRAETRNATRGARAPRPLPPRNTVEAALPTRFAPLAGLRTTRPSRARVRGKAAIALAVGLLALVSVVFALALVVFTERPVRLPPPLPQLGAETTAPTTPSPEVSAQPSPALAPDASSPRKSPTDTSSPRREAVDLLLSGRTRAALDAYRALAPRDAATERVIRVLERELRLCAQQGGLACGG